MSDNPTDPPANAAAPSAAEIAAIRDALARHDEYLKQSWGPQLPGPRADYERLRDMMPDFVRTLLAVTETQAARIGALESENAALKERQAVIMRVSEDKPGDGWNEDGFLKNGGISSGIVPYNRPSEGE